MSVQFKISEISQRLHVEYGLSVKASELNLLLISTGDLVNTALGKIETVQGRSRGISGEYRNLPPKDPYWIPLYNEQATAYVMDLARKVFISRLPNAPQDDNSLDTNELPASQPQEVSVSADSDNRTCRHCRLFINEECGMPQRMVCSFYTPCYIPTEADIAIMEAARQGFGVTGGMTETALGSPDPVDTWY